MVEGEGENGISGDCKMFNERIRQLNIEFGYTISNVCQSFNVVAVFMRVVH